MNPNTAPAQTAAEAAAQTPVSPAAEGQELDYQKLYEDMVKERDTWKGHARTWEDRAKENKDAAARLKEIEDQGKTEGERAAERAQQSEAELAAAQERIAELEGVTLRQKIAVEEGVHAPEDVKLLLGVSGEESVLRAFAKRLATGGHGAEAPGQGVGGKTSSRESIIERAKNLK